MEHVRRTWLLLALVAVGTALAAYLAFGSKGERQSRRGTGTRQVVTKQSASSRVRVPRVFAPNSIWNELLPRDAPLDPRSHELVAELQRQLAIGAPWINTYAYSTPIYRVPADQPTVKVTLDVPYSPLQQAWSAVPMPRSARPADGTDAHLVVWQRSTDTMWEFWHLRNVDGAWHARWGGRMTHVSRSPGYYTGAERSWGATATSLPLLGGLITLDDLKRDRINHALAMAIPEARRGSWSWPAQRTDGKSGARVAIREGARFRLDPTLDVDRLKLPPLVAMMAHAAQLYGIVVRDQAGVVTFYGEDPSPTGRNPWSGPGGWFQGKDAASAVRQFPWRYLQALRTNERCCSGS
jgi:hypothetical protein